MTYRKLPRSFYTRPTRRVARELLGKLLIRRVGPEILVARIVEVEAYLDRGDPASHAYRGRTRRNEVMFQEGGHLYVYFTYGMHFCCNVVTERKGRGCAVLLRAAEPVRGTTMMARNRGKSVTDLEALCSGPAKLCQALGISRPENGTDLTGRTLWLAEDSVSHRKQDVRQSTRVGIRNGREHLWRYYLQGNRYVSRVRLKHVTSTTRFSS
jgi:DNA-3-methyladenine glycosylase